MFFSKSFEATINQLSVQISSQDYVGRELVLSIQAWCNYLGLLEEEKTYIEKGLKSKEIQSSVSQDYSSGDIFLSLSGENQIKINVTTFTRNLDKRIWWGNQRMKFYLLLAFVIVSVGSALFLLSKKYKEQNYQGGGSQLSLPNIPYAESVQSIKYGFILMLVVNVKHESIINTLKNTGSITHDMPDQLYHATQELWFGSEEQYLNSQIKTQFNSQGTPYPSEYDVYFIKIKLVQENSKFNKNASQLSRRDGFMQLPKIAQEVKVSNRLSSKSYANIGVYSR